eukprot:3848118-Lingulodinium_polyedra.AAC.1
MLCGLAFFKYAPTSHGAVVQNQLCPCVLSTTCAVVHARAPADTNAAHNKMDACTPIATAIVIVFALMQPST